jgi:hypothetical protein
MITAKKLLPALLLSFMIIAVQAQNLVPCSCQDQGVEKRKYGYCDPFRTKFVITCQFDSVYQFNNSLARVIREGKTGYINPSGTFVIPAIYEEGQDFSDGLALVKKEGKYFYINPAGANAFKKNFYVPMPAMELDGASESVKKMVMAQVKSFLNNLNFHEGKVIVLDSASHMAGYMDKTGKMILPLKYLYASYFSEGVATVQESAAAPLVGINAKGEILFELKAGCMLVEGFSSGMAVVRCRPSGNSVALYNYIDKTGKLLFKESIPAAKPFIDNYAVITNNDNNMELIDKTGKNVLGNPYRYLKPTGVKGIYFYSNDTEKGFGLIDSSGKKLSKAGYINFTRLNDTLFLCKPWGTSLYTLLSTKRGEVIYSTAFQNYSWVEQNKKPILRLVGQDFFGKPTQLDFDPASGKFLRDGKELPAKDNFYLVTDEMQKEDAAELSQKRVLKYENEHFTISFPKEMELVIDSADRKVFHHSTYYFGINKTKYNGTAREYISRLAQNLRAGGKFESVDETLMGLRVGLAPMLVATVKPEAGKTQACYFYSAIEAGGYLYMVTGSYFVQDQEIYKKQSESAVASIVFK